MRERGDLYNKQMWWKVIVDASSKRQDDAIHAYVRFSSINSPLLCNRCCLTNAQINVAHL